VCVCVRVCSPFVMFLVMSPNCEPADDSPRGVPEGCVCACVCVWWCVIVYVCVRVCVPCSMFLVMSFKCIPGILIWGDYDHEAPGNLK